MCMPKILICIISPRHRNRKERREGDEAIGMIRAMSATRVATRWTRPDSAVWNHLPNFLLHSANGIQADSKGQSKRLSMSGQPRGPGGSGKEDAPRLKRTRRPTVRMATTM
jgi:hypothetical protein